MSTPSVSIGRLVGLALLAFLILASYEATRPPVESLFLAEHGRDALPQVWLLVAVGAAASVAVYNSFAARIALRSPSTMRISRLSARPNFSKCARPELIFPARTAIATSGLAER